MHTQVEMFASERDRKMFNWLKIPVTCSWFFVLWRWVMLLTNTSIDQMNGLSHTLIAISTKRLWWHTPNTKMMSKQWHCAWMKKKHNQPTTLVCKIQFINVITASQNIFAFKWHVIKIYGKLSVYSLGAHRWDDDKTATTLISTKIEKNRERKTNEWITMHECGAQKKTITNNVQQLRCVMNN